MTPKISIIVIAHKRADVLVALLDSLRSHCLGSNWEVVLVCNGHYADVHNVVLQYAALMPLRDICIVEQRPGAARNCGVEVARGEILLFLDDDVQVKNNIVGVVEELFAANPRLAAAGGANLTPLQSSLFEQASGDVLGSWLGAGRMHQRYRSRQGHSFADEHSLILCNLAVRKSIFRRYYFTQGVTSNEENLLLQQLSAEGACLVRTEGMDVYHIRRDSWLGLAQQVSKYGRGRLQNIMVLPTSFRFFYLLPLAFLLHLLCLPFVFSFLPMSVFAVFSVPLILYGFAVLIYWARFIWLVGRCYFLFPLLFPFIHIFYAIGFLYGLVSWPYVKRHVFPSVAVGAK